MASEEVEIECPVCYSAEKDVLVTNCHHKFCRSCLLKLLGKSPTTDCPVCRQTVSVCEVTSLSSGQALVERPSTIYGGVYVQCYTVGLASYHFSEEESYISYSAAPSVWRLADESPPPQKKPFLQPTYDPESRTFRGVVDWSEVNFGGDAQWIYRMVFSEDFMIIEEGEVISYGPHREKQRWTAYEQDFFYTRWIEELDDS